MPIKWRKACVNEQVTVGEVVQNLDSSKLQISLVLSSDDKLIGIVTDGDVRRGLLHGVTMDSPVSIIIKREAMVVPVSMDLKQVMQMMHANKVLQIPVVDEKSRVVGLHIWNEFGVAPSVKLNKMVIMAGGFGTRLMPHTEQCPKPMLLVHNMPILEHIILKAKDEGFCKFIIATYYLGEIIEDYFSQGEKWDIEIEYIKEESPLGTAGALGLLEETPSQPIVVTNGDVLTDINYSHILDFHCRNSSTATMAIRQHELSNPFGVVQTEGLNITGFEEKPTLKMNVNAGIYVLNPEALGCIENNSYFDMPSLFEKLRMDDKTIMAYPMHEEWMDIGRSNDLEKANSSIKYKNNVGKNNDI
jgi:dTDP-glucose pyrophosphorylase